MSKRLNESIVPRVCRWPRGRHPSMSDGDASANPYETATTGTHASERVVRSSTARLRRVMSALMKTGVFLRTWARLSLHPVALADDRGPLVGPHPDRDPDSCRGLSGADGGPGRQRVQLEVAPSIWRPLRRTTRDWHRVQAIDAE